MARQKGGGSEGPDQIMMGNSELRMIIDIGAHIYYTHLSENVGKFSCDIFITCIMYMSIVMYMWLSAEIGKHEIPSSTRSVVSLMWFNVQS